MGGSEEGVIRDTMASKAGASGKPRSGKRLEKALAWWVRDTFCDSVIAPVDAYTVMSVGKGKNGGWKVMAHHAAATVMNARLMGYGIAATGLKNVEIREDRDKDHSMGTQGGKMQFRDHGGKIVGRSFQARKFMETVLGDAEDGPNALKGMSKGKGKGASSSKGVAEGKGGHKGSKGFGMGYLSGGKGWQQEMMNQAALHWNEGLGWCRA